MRKKLVKLALFEMIYFFDEMSMDFLFALKKDSDFSKRRFFSINGTDYEVVVKKQPYTFSSQGITVRSELISLSASLSKQNPSKSLAEVDLSFKLLKDTKSSGTAADFKFEVMKAIFSKIKAFDTKFGPFDTFLLSTKSSKLKSLISTSFGSRPVNLNQKNFLFLVRNSQNSASYFNIVMDAQGQLAVLVHNF